jgi:histidinol phosphatase-like enzyme (inositol monophosphatase family)
MVQRTKVKCASAKKQRCDALPPQSSAQARPDGPFLDNERLIAFFRSAAEAAARETLPRFRTAMGIDNKETDGFDPVTEADKAVEEAVRSLLRGLFPGHGILGEEFGLENPDSRYRWVIDPIDGTRAFISGVPVWGTLIGLLEDGKAVAGMMAQPFTRELFHAGLEGAGSYEGPHGKAELRTRNTHDLADAMLFSTSPFLQTGQNKPRYDALEASVRMARYGTDCYAYAMLAAGHVDIVCESGLKPYDIVGLVPLIERAGGVVSQWDGGAAEEGGNILASANPRLHEQAMEILNR